MQGPASHGRGPQDPLAKWEVLRTKVELAYKGVNSAAKLEEVIRFSNDALKFAREGIGETSQQFASSCIALAGYEMELARFESAQAHLNTAANIYASDRATSAANHALLTQRQAELFAETGEWKKALSLFDTAVRYWRGALDEAPDSDRAAIGSLGVNCSISSCKLAYSAGVFTFDLGISSGLYQATLYYNLAGSNTQTAVAVIDSALTLPALHATAEYADFFKDLSPFYNDLLNSIETCFNPNHPIVAEWHIAMAAMTSAQKRFELTTRHFRQANRIYKSCYGASHPKTAMSGFMAGYYTSVSDPKDGARLMQEGLSHVDGMRPDYRAALLQGYAVQLINKKDLRGALTHLRSAKSALEAFKMTNDYPTITQNLTNLAARIATLQRGLAAPLN